MQQKQKHATKLTLKTLVLAMASTAPASVLAAVDIDFYGSLRMQAEAVHPDSSAEFANGGNSSYSNIRDAYSRLGITANWQANDAINVFGQLEVPIDTANFKIQDPYDDRRDLRVAQVGVSGDFGTLAYGQMWLPFYNAISYKVDRFSTYYSGYATLAFFRAFNTVSYYSPDFNGVSFGAGAVIKDTSDRADTFDDNRYQFTATYNANGTDFSIGIEQVDDNKDTRLLGAALGQQIDNLYLGIKLEQSSAKGSADANVFNLYADYTFNDYTFKAMYADVDGFGGQIFHLGADYQYSKNLKTFIEFYQQESVNALAAEKAGGSGSFRNPLGDFEPDAKKGGGKAVAVGFRYDF
ncbi:porin [Thiomicrospira cyclica]|uniref:Porin Gram-negative type n=1 Tax=Thiomicrospira cyclica (strain DSM 14477 / JCM 11371 / ALM1) TaxID=717773 RepID=F6D9J0_THICA|nr:porin [Thiomicrospira cyclica]AEG30947.1 porin Gram-negative type [Thiomicrospira cyclica ALM1]